MENPILLIDTWEDGGAIDEAFLKSKDISGMLVRLNDMNGGHHKDTGFDAQWIQAGALAVRIPYFVYNPWVSGRANFSWLVANMPPAVLGIAIDIEVSKPGYSPQEYAAEVSEFYSLVKSKWNCIIYTGEWFLSNLSYWPSADYWWAQYPNTLYPSQAQRMSWETLREKLIPYTGPFNIDKVPGECSLWQCSGDRLIMDGCEKAMDVNVWMGSMQDLISFAGLSNFPDPEPSTDKKYFTHIGVEANIIERFGAKCIVHIIDCKKCLIYVTPGGYQTVSAAITKYEAQIGANGGGWPNQQTPGHRANEIWVSNGTILQGSALDDRGYINIDIEGKPAISENSRIMAGLYNAWGFDRILGKDGVFNPRISDRTVKDARTGSGITADGKLIILSAEGNDRFQKGLTFPEMWEVLKEFGAVIAGNNDGGSSSAVINKALSAGSLILPSDGSEANVINQVLIFAEPAGEIPPDEIPTGDKPMYKVLAPARFRTTPTLNTKEEIPTNSILNDTFESSITKTDINNPTVTMVQHPNGKWLPLVGLDGKIYTKLISVTPQPDPDPNPPSVDIYIKVSGVVVANVSVNDIPYKKI